MNRLLVGVLCCVLILAGIASAQSPPTVERLWGSTKFDTNVEVLRATYPDGADRLTVVTGDNFPDALSALNVDGALLLVPTCGELPASTADLLDSWPPPESVTFLGGPSAICEAMADQVTTRWTGPNPEPTSTPTVEPTPEPTQEPTGWPDATTTGPTGPITQTFGSTTITDAWLATHAPDRTISGVRFNGQVTVQADDVTIENFIIDADDDSYGVYNSVFTGSPSTGLTLRDGEIVNAESSGLVVSNTVAERLHIHEMGADAIKPFRDVTVTDSYIHHLGTAEGAHADAFQMVSGRNVVIRGNNVEIPTPTPSGYRSNAAAIIQTNIGPITNVTIEGNRLNGGNFTVYSIDKNRGFGPPTGVRILDNVFGEDYRFGLFSLQGSVEKSGNTDLDGDPVG